MYKRIREPVSSLAGVVDCRQDEFSLLRRPGGTCRPHRSSSPSYTTQPGQRLSFPDSIGVMTHQGPLVSFESRPIHLLVLDAGRPGRNLHVGVDDRYVIRRASSQIKRINCSLHRSSQCCILPRHCVRTRRSRKWVALVRICRRLSAPS